ncbi:unnamed protein product [Hymenolepis diminuta]|uniref:Transmembrane BAX inhibitor motif-containing protein 4 n=1 Tax=Hymenolepis diminuta TaxID=6216 RepID=A0A0R3SV15_HYMDI|nr:unnamed protein product [Hymenolepis diminuta]VUZ40208.1 unnamed protein product [Hymenolepis diminuta]
MIGSDLEGKLENDFEFNNCVKGADIYIRMGFVRKIYSILSVQLLLTCFTGAIMCTFKEPVSLFLSDKPYILFGLFIASIVLMIAMFVKRYDNPINFILLFTFTIAESFLVGLAVVHYDTNMVLQAFFITLAVTVSLTIYSMQTKREFSSWASCLGCCLLALLVGGISNVFFGLPVIQLATSIGGAILFSFFLIYDTQMMMQRYSPEEYIVAAITLYLDILNLFLYILRILQSTNNN